MAIIAHCLVLLLGLGVSLTEAQRIDYSCAEFKGKNSEGVETNYGDVRGNIAMAVQEVGVIADTARTYLLNAAEQKGDKFDITRTVQSFNSLQGEKDGTEMSKQGRWNKVLESLKTIKEYVDDRNNRDPGYICGDGHLQKFTHYGNGARIQDSRGRDSYMYYDTFTKDYWPIGEPACEDDPGTIAMTQRGGYYIQVCPAGFSFAQRTAPRSTINGDNLDTDVDWSDEKYEGDYRQSLDYWATPLSYTLFHELTHALLDYLDYDLKTEVSWLGGSTNKAYKFNGATQLVKENLNHVSNNVDNLGMLALSLFMKSNNWSSGHARRKEQGKDSR